MRRGEDVRGEAVVMMTLGWPVLHVVCGPQALRFADGSGGDSLGVPPSGRAERERERERERESYWRTARSRARGIPPADD
jgi:hypothetical protein